MKITTADRSPLLTSKEVSTKLCAFLPASSKSSPIADRNENDSRGVFFKGAARLKRPADGSPIQSSQRSLSASSHGMDQVAGPNRLLEIAARKVHDTKKAAWGGNTMSSIITDRGKCLARISNVLALTILCLSVSASAQGILYTQHTNPPPPGVTPPANSYDTGQTWASRVCSSDNLPTPAGSEIEWAPVLDPGQDAETHLVAVSGTVVYNPSPVESGFCQGMMCPGQPKLCSSDSDCNSCGPGGSCDLGQGPSCTGGSCNTPFTNPQPNPQVGSPISCLNDTPCVAACGGSCTALGRSRGDMPMTHPFGFDYDAAIVPDAAYLSLLSPGNVESTHVDPSDPRTALDGFGGIVYPFRHAILPVDQIDRGWCTPNFLDTNRCTSDADCPSDAGCPNGICRCEGAVNGLGLVASSSPGVLGVETDHDLIPDSYQPQDGDRTALFGRWIVDCGHGDEEGTSGWHTEIHPPLLVATGRGTGSGYFGANCSGEQTCSSVIGRPFLVSQQFGDG